MVGQKYPATPFINDYCIVMAEATEAHFLGLGHVAVAGLIPSIEGIVRNISIAWGLPQRRNTPNLVALCTYLKDYSVSRQVGEVNEIVSMLDAFSKFATDQLYADTASLGLSDGTNRHGIAHGLYDDADYGRPLNFFKAIAAIDILTFMVCLHEGGSILVPDATEETVALTRYYQALQQLASSRVTRTGHQS